MDPLDNVDPELALVGFSDVDSEVPLWLDVVTESTKVSSLNDVIATPLAPQALR